jgi:NAD(P)-dependent dehydrogenase (short-subunit alcohol dehydrogenase family)
MQVGKGAIVNISSIVSSMATPSGLAYGASKAGVEQLSRSLAIIGAADGARVRCNSVHPGVIRSRMTDSIIASFAAAQSIDEAQAEVAVCAAVPFGVRGVPEDVAGLITYLASDAAAYVTGSAFRVDGGWSVTSAG